MEFPKAAVSNFPALLGFMSQGLSAPECLQSVEGIPDRVVLGVIRYLTSKRLVTQENLDQSFPLIIRFLRELNEIMGGADFSHSHFFRYITESSDLETVLSSALENARFLVEKMGADFFARDPEREERPQYWMKARIDDDFYLALRGGSGMGTFCLDFVIGAESGQYFQISKELWRSSLDTEVVGEERHARIIRTGGGSIKQRYGDVAAEKQDMCKLFGKRYGITPPRALAFLMTYVARDLGVDAIRAFSLEGVRKKSLTNVGSSRINFDYTKLFTGVGFQPSENRNWLEMQTDTESFYRAITTETSNKDGLRRHEASGLQNLLFAFQALEVTRTQEPCPLTVCSNQTSEDVAAALNAHYAIQGRRNH